MKLTNSSVNFLSKISEVEAKQEWKLMQEKVKAASGVNLKSKTEMQSFLIKYYPEVEETIKEATFKQLQDTVKILRE